MKSENGLHQRIRIELKFASVKRCAKAFNLRLVNLRQLIKVGLRLVKQKEGRVRKWGRCHDVHLTEGG